MPPLVFPTTPPCPLPLPLPLPLRRRASSHSPSFPALHLKPLSLSPSHRPHTPLAAANSHPSDPPVASKAEIELLPGRDGVFSARLPSVVILWDLDNKPPRGKPFDAAAALRTTSALLGEVREFSAYANRHAFTHVPEWVRSERRDQRRMDMLERQGLVTAADPYTCGMCGRKFTTRPELKRHFKQLHERERMKKVNRMHSLKGKKKDKFRARYISGNQKYEETARELLTPKVGYGLASELKRAGVNVQTVKSKPQAADAALKARVMENLARGVDWMVLVSDDSDFIETVQMARAAELRTVVVGDGQRALGRIADIWLPWVQVEKGQITDNMLKSKMHGGGFAREDDEEEDEDNDEDEDDDYEDGPFVGSWLLSEDEESDDFDDVVQEIIGGRSFERGRRREKGRGRGRGARRGRSCFSDDDESYGEFRVEISFDEGELGMFDSLSFGDLFGDNDVD